MATGLILRCYPCGLVEFTVVDTDIEQVSDSTDSLFLRPTLDSDSLLLYTRKGLSAMTYRHPFLLPRGLLLKLCGPNLLFYFNSFCFVIKAPFDRLDQIELDIINSTYWNLI